MPKPRIKRSVFSKSLTFENKLSFDFGMIVPILAEDLLPGDNFYYSPEVFLRCAPLVAPMMQLCDVHIDVFKIPFRLLMRDTPQIPGFETFISPKDVFGEGVQPNLTSFKLTFLEGFEHHYDNFLAPGSLSDYLGLPTIDANFGEIVGTGQEMKFRALDHIGYQWVRDEFYRKEDLQEPVLDEDTDFLSQIIEDDELIDKLGKLHYRNWPNDYFTSALPNTQRGIDVGIPITADVPIEYVSNTSPVDARHTTVLRNSNSAAVIETGNNLQLGTQRMESAGGGTYMRDEDNVGHWNVDNSGNLIGHLSNVVATINDLRLSVALQAWAEASMRGGARYPEILMSTFGVRPRDARLDRPECMGRVSFPLQISEVLQTSQTTSGDDGSPQGNMSGRGVAYGRGRYIHIFAEEHCLLHAYISIMPRASYQQGLPKRYTKFDKFDYYWPQFDALGEQAIAKREIYYDFNADWSDPESNEETFGYQQRYCEYKAFFNQVHGDFKLQGLNAWHMGRIFASQPSLNDDFINYESEVDAMNQRIFASGSTNRSHIWCQVLNRIRAKRPMSYQVIPHLKG